MDPGEQPQTVRLPKRTGRQCAHPAPWGRRARALAAAMCIALGAWPSSATAGSGSGELLELGLEELMDVEVISVSKKAQKVSESAAAVYVITREDIRRSGVTSLPEALRMAPGVEVARINASTWAITVRGFNDRFSNKLLVLVDGRTVYTPLFSGVYWDVQDTLLEDVERIEVIRGPGATLWGANAVNGVINIITRSAKETQGTLATATFGTEDRAVGAARYGGRWGRTAYYRLYAKGFARDGGRAPGGGQADDGWNALRGGFRIDADPGELDALTLQGDVYTGESDLTYTFPSVPPLSETQKGAADVSGGNLLGRWTRAFSPRSELRFQAYYDRTRRDDPLFEEHRDTVDLDVQHRFQAGGHHEVVWGLGYRLTRDRNRNRVLSLAPKNRTDHLVSAFAQDEIQVSPDRVSLTLGAKLERNDYTGFELQPSARVLLHLLPGHSLWAAVSRAVRTPSRVEHDARLPTANPFPLPGGGVGFLTVFGDGEATSERLTALELGYRALLSKRLTADLAAFVHAYDHLRSLELGKVPNHQIEQQDVPTTVDNQLRGTGTGVELALDAAVAPWWRLKGSYTYFRLQLRTDPGSTDLFSENDEGRSPEHRLTLRSSMDLPHALELDVTFRYVGRLPQGGADRYATADVRLGWRPRADLELAVVGQNLFQRAHAEFVPGKAVQTAPSEVERGVYGKLTWYR